jgi:hypothetical protein
MSQFGFPQLKFCLIASGPSRKTVKIVGPLTVDGLFLTLIFRGQNRSINRFAALLVNKKSRAPPVGVRSAYGGRFREAAGRPLPRGVYRSAAPGTTKESRRGARIRAGARVRHAGPLFVPLGSKAKDSAAQRRPVAAEHRLGQTGLNRHHFPAAPSRRPQSACGGAGRTLHAADGVFQLLEASLSRQSKFMYSMA